MTNYTPYPNLSLPHPLFWLIQPPHDESLSILYPYWIPPASFLHPYRIHFVLQINAKDGPRGDAKRMQAGYGLSARCIETQVGGAEGM